MTGEARVWVKELTGVDLGNIPGLIANGYAVYMSAMGDKQGWLIADVNRESTFDGPSTVKFADGTLGNVVAVGADEKRRVYIVGWPEPWAKQS